MKKITFFIGGILIALIPAWIIAGVISRMFNLSETGFYIAFGMIMLVLCNPFMLKKYIL